MKHKKAKTHSATAKDKSTPKNKDPKLSKEEQDKELDTRLKDTFPASDATAEY